MGERPVATRRGARFAHESAVPTRKSAAKPAAGATDPTQALPPALLSRATKLRELLGEAEAGDSAARHKVALLVKEVRDAPDTYGERAVAQLATQVGLGAATLYRYADVGDCWPDAKTFVEAAARRTKSGRPLGWAMFVALAQERDGRVRRGLHLRVVEKDLSVRDVRRDVASRKARKAVSLAASLAALRRQAAALAASTRKTVSEATADAGKVPGRDLAAIRACAAQLARLLEVVRGAAEKLEALAEVVGAPHPEESD